MSKIVDDPRLLKGRPGQIAGSSAKDESVEQQYMFCQGVVVEYISNPADYLDREGVDKSTKQSTGKVTENLVGDKGIISGESTLENPEISRFMPRNSIICHVNRGAASSSTFAKPVIAFPFFPSHFSLPLKPTERVWVLKEIHGNQTNYYWMCRVVADRQSDDLNITSFDRNFHIRNLLSEFDLKGAVSSNELIVPATAFVTSPNSPLPKKSNPDMICGSSISYLEEFTGEPVPRFSKQCEDLVLQGSNNTLVHFCKEKFLGAATDDSTLFANKDAKLSNANKRKPMRGTIDIVAGLEKERLIELKDNTSPDTASSSGNFNVIKNNRQSGGLLLEHFETDKIDEPQGRKENKFEGNDSPRNVFARSYLSMNASPDISFEMTNTDFESFSGPTHVNYSDNCRTFAENSIRLYKYSNDAGLDSCIDMAPDGTITFQSGEGLTAAKIILKPDGNIVLKPGTGGFLHLGGDESELSGVAVSINPVSTEAGIAVPQVPGSTDTFGGSAFLGDPVSGFVSSKVLIKI